MMRTINRLNEEIARWAFEIIFKTNSEWTIAFTNPTAGPWKTIKTVSKETGREGEVYRFILEEDRPDIIMYSDSLEAVIIIEAKDSLEKLKDRKQAKKSADVVIKLADLLRSKGSNEFWKGREDYRIILGLLWGSTEVPEGNSEKTRLYDYYHDLIEGEDSVFTDLIVGIETLYRNEELSCKSFYKAYDPQAVALGERIVESLL